YAEVATIDDQGGEHPLVSVSGGGEVVVTVCQGEDLIFTQSDYAQSMHIPMALSAVMGVGVTPTVIADDGTDVSIHLYSDVDMITEMPEQAGLTVVVGDQQPVPAAYDEDTHSYTASVSASVGANTMELALAGRVFASVEFTPVPVSIVVGLSSSAVCMDITAAITIRDAFLQPVCGLEGVTLTVSGGDAMSLTEGEPSEGSCTYNAEMALPCEVETLEFSVDVVIEGVPPLVEMVSVVAGDIDPQASVDTLDRDTPVRPSSSTVLIFEPRDAHGNNVSQDPMPSILVTVNGPDFEACTYYCGAASVRGTERYECLVNIPATSSETVYLTFGREMEKDAPLVPFGDPIQQRVLGEQQMERVSLTPVTLLSILSLLLGVYAVYTAKHKGGYSELLPSLPSLPSVMVSPVRKDD
ncbi:hypothetical protein KIPB_010900, partial [Kipferlia bialata]